MSSSLCPLPPASGPPKMGAAGSVDTGRFAAGATSRLPTSVTLARSRASVSAVVVAVIELPLRALLVPRVRLPPQARHAGLLAFLRAVFLAALARPAHVEEPEALAAPAFSNFLDRRAHSSRRSRKLTVTPAGTTTRPASSRLRGAWVSAQALTFFSLALIYRRPRPHREFVARVLSRRTGACARFARSATHCTSEPSTSTVKPLRILCCRSQHRSPSTAEASSSAVFTKFATASGRARKGYRESRLPARRWCSDWRCTARPRAGEPLGEQCRGEFLDRERRHVHPRRNRWSERAGLRHGTRSNTTWWNRPNSHRLHCGLSRAQHRWQGGLVSNYAARSEHAHPQRHDHLSTRDVRRS